MPISSTSSILRVSALTLTPAMPPTGGILTKAAEFSRVLFFYTDSQCATSQGGDSSHPQAMKNVCVAPSEAGKYVYVSVTGPRAIFRWRV